MTGVVKRLGEGAGVGGWQKSHSRMVGVAKKIGEGTWVGGVAKNKHSGITFMHDHLCVTAFWYFVLQYWTGWGRRRWVHPGTPTTCGSGLQGNCSRCSGGSGCSPCSWRTCVPRWTCALECMTRKGCGPSTSARSSSSRTTSSVSWPF